MSVSSIPGYTHVEGNPGKACATCAHFAYRPGQILQGKGECSIYKVTSRETAGCPKHEFYGHKD